MITDYAPDHSERVRDYLTLLGLPMPPDQAKDIVLPVHLAIKARELNAVAISTRSTFGLIEILRAATEIPTEHAGSGMARNFPTPGPAWKDICIHASEDKPKQAAVAVKHRGYWFYIDDTDMHTKLFYVMVRMLWSISIEAAADMRGAPVLTIPVSR